MKKTNNYAHAIQVIKTAILKSRYRAAALANRELLSLYYGVGKFISENSRNGFWGTSAIDTICEKLQLELPGLRGFSAGNVKKMRIFFEQWCEYIENRASATHDLKLSTKRNSANRASATHDLELSIDRDIEFAALATFENEKLPSGFMGIGFTHHYEILKKTQSLEERLFYIERCAAEFWSVEGLRYNLKSRLFTKQGKMPNNFNKVITDKDLQRKALLSFKDEYLLDYINIESPDDEPDERVLENGIVSNIRKFIMSLGKDFSFVGSQYRLVFEKREYFLDLLFFNRQLQCLVAIELKRGDFKPEYMGKMNFYLSVLDDSVKLPHENPSIGIILCKTKNKRIVEFSFRDMTKPMGVATYKTASKLPAKYRNVLPDAEQLKELL